MRAENKRREILEHVFWAIWSFSMLAYGAIVSYHVAPYGSGKFWDYIMDTPPPGFALCLMISFYGFFGLTVKGCEAWERTAKREKIRQRWLRRYAHRPVRQYPDISP